MSRTMDAGAEAQPTLLVPPESTRHQTPHMSRSREAEWPAVRSGGFRPVDPTNLRRNFARLCRGEDVEETSTRLPADVPITTTDPQQDVEETPWELTADVPRTTSEPPEKKPREGTRFLENEKRTTSPPLVERAANPQNWRDGVWFRHRSWEDDRDRVRSVLESGDFPQARLDAFCACGQSPVVFEDANNPGRFKVGCKRCHDRFCLPCAQDRARLIFCNLKEAMPPGPVRFLTLTLKHTDAPLAEQLDRLYTCFAKLRRRAFWRKSVKGGCAFCEVKLSRTDSRWHPHLHVMLQGKYLPQALLADAWLEVTGDSRIVDIRLARGEGEVVRYLTSYVTKGWSSHLFRLPDKLAELIHAFSGRKLVLCFGAWSKFCLLKPATDGTWIPLGTLYELRVAAREGDTLAAEIVSALCVGFYVAPVEPMEFVPEHSP